VYSQGFIYLRGNFSVPQHASRDKSVQAFSPLFILQATKAGFGGKGMRLGVIHIIVLLFVGVVSLRSLHYLITVQSLTALHPATLTAKPH